MNRGVALVRALRAQDGERPFTLGEIDELHRLAAQIASRERLKDREYRQRHEAGLASQRRPSV